MSTYTNITDKIKKAETVEELDKLEKSIDNLYTNGIFTISEFARLDSLIINKKIKIED